MHKTCVGFYITILVFFFVLQFLFLRARMQSFKFADENEHLVPAWSMAEQQKSLYRDLSTNHQPLPIFVAYVFLLVVKFTNLFMLIERVRQFMLFLSFLGAFALLLRFGLRGLIASVLVEMIKFYFLGYHLLAESLIVYPLMYVAGVLCEYTFLNALQYRWLRLDEFAFGFCVFWVAFSFLPAWPFLCFATLLFLYLRGRLSKSTLPVGVIMSFIVPTLVLFLAISPVAWFQETIVNNLKYLLPYEASLNTSGYLSFLIYPFLSVFNLHQVIGRYYLLLTFLAVVGVAVVLFRPHGRIRTGLVLLSYYLLLITLNLRIATLDIGFYGAFHVLPQAAFLTMLTTSVVYFSHRLPMTPAARGIFIGTAVLIMVAAIMSASSWWWESSRIDKWREYFIQYGDDESVGMAVSAIGRKGDTLLAGEQGGFINIVAGMPLATRQTAYLAWAYRSLAMREEFYSFWTKSPPTFVYFPQSNNPYFLALKPMLDKKYTRAQRSFGGQTDLYMLSTEASKRLPSEWKKFSDLLYKPLTD